MSGGTVSRRLLPLARCAVAERERAACSTRGGPVGPPPPQAISLPQHEPQHATLHMLVSSPHPVYFLLSFVQLSTAQARSAEHSPRTHEMPLDVGLTLFCVMCDARGGGRASTGRARDGGYLASGLPRVVGHTDAAPPRRGPVFVDCVTFYSLWCV